MWHILTANCLSLYSLPTSPAKNLEVSFQLSNCLYSVFVHACSQKIIVLTSVSSTHKLPKTNCFLICNFSKIDGKHHKINFVYYSALKHPKTLNDFGHHCSNHVGLHAGCDTIHNISSNFFSLPKSVKICTRRWIYFWIHTTPKCA